MFYDESGSRAAEDWVFVAFQTNLASRRRASKAYENHRTRTTFREARFTAGLQCSVARHLAQDDFQEKLSPLTFLKSRLRKYHSSLFQSPRSHSLNLQKCASVCSETRLQRSCSLSTQILETQRAPPEKLEPLYADPGHSKSEHAA